MNPMYLAYRPPQMLPTQTLNPTASATGTSSAKATSKAKRNFDEPSEFQESLNAGALLPREKQTNPDKWWGFGLAMTAIGGVGYLCF